MHFVKDEGSKGSQLNGKLNYLNTQIVNGEMCRSYEWKSTDLWSREHVL